MDKQIKIKKNAAINKLHSNNDLCDYQGSEYLYPVIERTYNALLWPENIKEEIDIEEFKSDYF